MLSEIIVCENFAKQLFLWAIALHSHVESPWEGLLKMIGGQSGGEFYGEKIEIHKLYTYSVVVSLQTQKKPTSRCNVAY